MTRRGVGRRTRAADDTPETTGERAGSGASSSADAQSGAVLRIDEVSRLTGLSKRTLRYYEELGLLERARRSEGNYRMYRVEDLTALQRIKEMRDLLGLELSEIRDILGFELEREQLRARWRQDDAPASRLGAITDAERVTREQLGLIESRIAALQEMGQSLRERLALYERLRAEIRAREHLK